MWVVREVARLLGFLLGTLLFILCMAMDVRKAFKRGVYWVPGNALVLSALTIQIMTFVENQSDRVFLGSKTMKDEGVNNFVMIHSTRVMICVLVAFFLPGVARASHENKLARIAALGLTIFVDIFSEFLTLYHRFSDSVREGVSWVSFLISDVIISISLMWLILLLVCAARASESIRNIANQRVPFILAQDTEPDAANNWEAIERQVLKSWIVVYVCSPATIIAKSVLTSSAALVVTICIVSSIAGWVVRGPAVTIHADAESSLKVIITLLEIVFILTGWVVIGWRSLASVRYQERWKKKGWLDWFKECEIWTVHTKEELEKEETKNERIDWFWTKHVEARQNQRKLREDESFVDHIISRALWKIALLRCVLLLQFIVVTFSKVSSLLTEVTFYNGVMRKIVSVLSKDDVEEEFEESKAILDKVDVVGENPRSVFATSRKAIKHAKDLSRDGYKDGNQGCKSLIKFLKDKTSSWPPLTGKMSPPLCVGARGSFVVHPETAAEPVSPLKFFLSKPAAHLLEGEAYFKYMKEGSWSWKLTAVSLINVIVSLWPKNGKECLVAYAAAWQLTDIVDEWEGVSDSILRKGADREFDKLVDRVRQNTDEHCKTATIIKKITELADKKKLEVEEECKKAGNERQSFPVDWEKLAAAIALYKLYSSSAYYASGAQMNNETESSLNFAELKEELERLLADTIAACMDRVGIALVESCRKWAQSLEDDKKEERLLNAIYVAGKSKGLLEALGWKVTDQSRRQ
eukprot:PITA_32542